MEFKVLLRDLVGGSPNYFIVHPDYLKTLDVEPGLLIKIIDRNQGFRLMSSSIVPPTFAAISPEIAKHLRLKEGDVVECEEIGLEKYTRVVRRKMARKALNKQEITDFLDAIEYGYVADSHIATFGTAIEINSMNLTEVTDVAAGILEHSKKLTHKRSPIVDKHSIGGIAGNRITPIMIPIIAAAGLTIPKVSTRAITSPAGTSDALEVVMGVEFTLEETAQIVEKTNGCMVDGLKIGLGAVADKFLRVVKQVKIDPKEMMLASILSKKKAAGSKYVLIDLPTGKGSKLPQREDARQLASQFAALGSNLGLQIESIVSPGDTPIGTMIGPALEIKEGIQILEGQTSSLSLEKKAVSLSGIIFEMVGKANPGEGYNLAREILTSGKALDKFKEICEAQGGDPKIKSEDVQEARYTHVIKATTEDTIYSLDSYNVGLIARAAGAPKDKYSGLIIHKQRGDIVHEGDALITIWANSEHKIDEAIQIMETAPPYTMERMILEHIKAPREFKVDI